MRELAVPVIACLLALTGLYLLRKPPADGGAAVPASAAAVRNVIFNNGDGMAAAHPEAGRLFLAGPDGSLAMDRLPYSGQLTTSPADPASVVTDSAAGASAWATGRRTYNGAVSVDTRGRSLPTLGAQAKRAGRATGLVTTAQVTDATPAAEPGRPAASCAGCALSRSGSPRTGDPVGHDDRQQ